MIKMSEDEKVILHYKKGFYYFFIESWDIAVGFFEKALEINPNHYKSLESAGMSYYRLAQIVLDEDEDIEKAKILAQKSKEMYLRAAENSPDYFRGDECMRMVNVLTEEFFERY